MMIRYLAFFSLTYLLSNCPYAKGLIGENIWPAAFSDFPFIASLGLKAQNSNEKRTHFCTGTLISRIHVLTAASCVEQRSPNLVDVAVGENDLSSGLVRPYEVDSWITYEDWAHQHVITIEYSMNDIAIVKLSLPAYGLNKRPVVITALNDKQLYGTNGLVAGWGRTNTGTNNVNKLQRARVRILSQDDCAKKVELITNDLFVVDNNYLCDAGEQHHVIITCGDIGGPLLDKKNVLLGVASGTCPNETTSSWSINSSVQFIQKYKVNQHMSVDYYRDFIEDVTNLLTRPREVYSYMV